MSARRAALTADACKRGPQRWDGRVQRRALEMSKNDGAKEEAPRRWTRGFGELDAPCSWRLSMMGAYLDLETEGVEHHLAVAAPELALGDDAEMQVELGVGGILGQAIG